MGLTFRVTDKGVKTFSYRFRDPTSGRVGRVTLGRYPDLTLAKARARADSLRASVAEGVNPAEQKRRQRLAATTRAFGVIADRYIEEYAKRHKKASSVAEDERNLRLHVKPRWGKLSIDEISRAHVVELTEDLAGSGREVLANRVQALISGIFTFALDAGLTKSNPCWRLRKRGAEKAATRVLSDDEIRFFWPAAILPPLTRRTGLALRLMLLTGVRPGEAAGLHRSELENLGQPEQAVWTIPGSRTKNGLTHVVPLSAAALGIVKRALELIDADEQFVFVSPKAKGRAMRPHSLTVAMKRMVGKVKGPGAKTWKADIPTPHDLRRTFRTRLSALGVPKDLRDRLMNHVPQDVGTRHYDQYEFVSEKRDALGKWADALKGILEPKQKEAA
jgi:integrase